MSKTARMVELDLVTDIKKHKITLNQLSSALQNGAISEIIEPLTLQNGYISHTVYPYNPKYIMVDNQLIVECVFVCEINYTWGRKSFNIEHRSNSKETSFVVVPKDIYFINARSFIAALECINSCEKLEAPLTDRYRNTDYLLGVKVPLSSNGVSMVQLVDGRNHVALIGNKTRHISVLDPHRPDMYLKWETSSPDLVSTFLDFSVPGDDNE